MQLTPFLDDPTVHCIAVGASGYPDAPPYGPSSDHPELAGRPASTSRNWIFEGVRDLLRSLSYDEPLAGTPRWNPLGWLVHPGDTVVLKPNLVSHRNLGFRRYGLTDTDSLVTHGSVVRAVAEYVALALEGRGRIIVGDAPVQGTSWDDVVGLLHLDAIGRAIEQRYPGVTFACTDFRLARAVVRGSRVVERIVDDERRGEFREIDLGSDSLLVPLMTRGVRFGVSQYPQARMIRAHAPSTNLYLFPSDVLDADVVINLPKMKLHQKAGVTCALKNLVGVIGHKDYLPHYRVGSPRSGGDEFPDGPPSWHLLWWLAHREWEHDRGWRKRGWHAASRAVQGVHELLLRGTPPTIGGGSWWGNDTLWRTVLDINRAFFYADRETGRAGPTLAAKPRYLAIADAVIGGEGESPLAPSPVATGLIMAARNPVALDTVATALMGLDLDKVALVREAQRLASLPLTRVTREAIGIRGNVPFTSVADIHAGQHFTRYRPSRGFAGHVEYPG